MPKKPDVNKEDLQLFHEAVAGTKPLVEKKIRLAKKNPKPISPPPVFADEPLTFSHAEHLEDVSGEAFISYKQPSISHKVLRKLRKGQYNVDAILDLHGMSIDEASVAVSGFLKACLQKDIRCALIIHGKGMHSDKPILKNKLNHWLRELDMVLAFCSATKLHGSRGAIYILLKRTIEGEKIE